MNYLVSQKIQEYEQVGNITERVVKINQSLEFIIMYYATIFYCHTKAEKLVSKEIVEIILTNFHKKNPLTSSWIKLLKASLDLLKIDQKNFDKNLGVKIQIAAKEFLPDSSKKKINVFQRWDQFYNMDRLHSGIGYLSPYEYLLQKGIDMNEYLLRNKVGKPENLIT